MLASCGNDEADPAPGVVAKRPSRSSSVTLSEDGERVAMVNVDDGSLSVFQTSDQSRIARVPTGKRPSSVVMSPDSKTAYVANRGDGTVVRVAGLDGTKPGVDATVDVGSDPVGLALSPTGKKLFVAEFAESRVTVIDTEKMTVISSHSIDRPRALVVTNNQDESDDDEKLVVTQFYGTPIPGAEAQDVNRTGVVRVYRVADLAQYSDITLAPLDSGFHKDGKDTLPTVQTSPNQLYSVATANGRVYVTSVSASPADLTRFDNNVFPVVHVADLATNQEVRDASGTVNLARKVFDAIPEPTPENPRFVPGDLVDMDFIPGTGTAYAIGRAADLMQRITFGATVTIGSSKNVQVDLGGNDELGRCQAPSGIAVDNAKQLAFIACPVTRRLAVVDLDAQKLIKTVEAAPAPETLFEKSVARGARFYFTGRGRWSNAGDNGGKGGQAFNSCASCHPDGYSDNITWIFGSGPRQTTSQDGSFSHGPGMQKQRMFNWSGIFDRHHDFERNVRDVANGIGVITRADDPNDCNKLDKEISVPLVQANGNPIAGLGQPLKELADNPNIANCKHADWDDIENFVRTIPPVQAKRSTDPAAIARGRELFAAGRCDNCHGGAGWTVSRLFYTPSSEVNDALGKTDYVRPGFLNQTLLQYDDVTGPRKFASIQPIIPIADVTGDVEPEPVAFVHSACSLRNVGTFGIPGNKTATDALEKRSVGLTGALGRSLGRAGYNVPSLYGLALGAPYLHHGQAATLEELFGDPRWSFHTNAGAANFSLKLDADPQALLELAAFLRSIDATTPEFAIPGDGFSTFDACPLDFRAP